MKLKRFTAQNRRTAMQQVKTTFGPDAVILSINEVDGGVEIVAAIDFDETVISAQAAVASAEPASQVVKTADSTSPWQEMQREIQTLRVMVEAQLRDSQSGPEPLHRVLLQKLMYLGMSQHSAASLVRTIRPDLNQETAWMQLVQNLSASLAIHEEPQIEEGGVYAFVGPTGVGKTTTLAKIAARFALHHGADKLGLVTMDSYRIAAHEQLVLYGKILGVSVCVANDNIALSRVLQQLNDKKLILIDTAGMNPADERVDVQMDILTSLLHSISTVLIIPATSYYQILIDAIHRYRANRIRQCIVTKLDECLSLGGILSALAETGVPVSYFTHGQRVPEDIKLATRHQLLEQFNQQEKKLVETMSLRPVAGRAYVTEY